VVKSNVRAMARPTKAEVVRLKEKLEDIKRRARETDRENAEFVAKMEFISRLLRERALRAG
jgi:tRNA nucleotidyltransferase (CCA-adding enzyme)